ncbi:MAG TPA: hemerythrin domain-containing protein [Nitrospira sp.]|nr:hemerythrin domain-containing protein [Nitrospira sp.]
MPKQPKKSTGGSSRKKAPEKKPSDALELLKADHETVMSLFRRHGSASPDEQASIAKQIFNELEIHSTVEEELFYPALREQGDLKELAELEGDEPETDVVDGQDLSEEGEEEEAEEEDGEILSESEEETEEEEGEDIITLAYEDHKAVRQLIQELRGLDPGSDQYRTRFDELREAVTDHVGEEEEVLFPEAKLKLDTKQIGAEIIKRRSDLASSMAA